jgi:aminoglycoside phosphotransferase (APT) family kinase protein
MEELLKAVIQKNPFLNGLPVKKYTGGWVNHAYQIGDKFVVKIEKDLDVLGHQPEIIEKCLSVGAKVPHILDHGVVGGKVYLVMEKIAGRKLSEDWLSFSPKVQEQFIVQIVEQLKIFHSISCPRYSLRSLGRDFDNFKDFIESLTDFSVIDESKLDEATAQNLALVKAYYRDHEHVLDETGTAVFVHNDLHFENILYEDEQLTGIIDFDFVRQAPKDYELCKMVDFFNNPAHYVEKQTKSIWEGYVGNHEMELLKKYYPELFTHQHLPERMRLYLIDDLLGRLHDGYPNNFNKRTHLYFKTDVLEKQLSLRELAN